METNGFYKNDEGQLLYGPNYVLNLNYELRKELKEDYVFPVDGWYWFDSEDDAYLFFGLEKPKNEEVEENTINNTFYNKK